jgi:hypothetical protein
LEIVLNCWSHTYEVWQIRLPIVGLPNKTLQPLTRAAAFHRAKIRENLQKFQEAFSVLTDQEKREARQRHRSAKYL